MHLPDDADEILKQADRVAYLLSGYIKKDLTSDEQIELEKWINESEKNKRLFAELTNPKYVGQMMDRAKKLKQ